MKLFFPLVLLIASCGKSQPPSDNNPKGFADTPAAFAISGGAIAEASGLADSKTRPGHLWVNEDSGNPSQLYLLRHDGAIVDSVEISGAVNRDWEEIALSAGQLYIGDIGDNNAVYPSYNIYRFPEPAASVSKVTTFDRIEFRYADTSHDAEAFLVEPSTKDIYIITKRDTRSRIYKLSHPQSISETNVAEFVMELPYSGVVAASASADFTELIVKTYTTLYYYYRDNGENVQAALSKTPSTLAYKLEPQGEAVSFALSGSGFFTLSEQAFGVIPPLNFYKRKQ